MTKLTSLPTIAGALLAFGFSAVPAHALAGATFVSGQGSDSGVCTRALPCKTFAFALSQTAAGGVILVLDPAGYGAVTITKAISILNDGVGTAGIGGSSGNAITINAGANDSVHLHGLTIEGFGIGTNGIVFNTGGNLAIENCAIRGFNNVGIFISPSTSSSFSVSNTIASKNFMGILVQPTGSAAVTGVLSKVTAHNNFANGIFVDGAVTTGASLNVTIVDSEASNHTNTGIFVNSITGGHAVTAVMVRNAVISNNGTGLCSTNATLRVAHSVVTGNNTVVCMVGTDSYGDNDIDGNTNNNTGNLGVIPTH